MSKLAFVYKEMGKAEVALSVYQQCLSLEEDTTDTDDVVLSIKENIAGTYHELG